MNRVWVDHLYSREQNEVSRSSKYVNESGGENLARFNG